MAGYQELLRQAESDLGVNVPFMKGMTIQVKNCWHFSTDGNAVDAMFQDEADFKAGMNRVYIVLREYRVLVLAFSLMDTHVHFVLYGPLEECSRFMHEYVRRTSMYIAQRHKERKKMDEVPIHRQTVGDDGYLKTVICYVVKNAPVAGIPFNGIDYPWSSGALYFRPIGGWTAPAWRDRERLSRLPSQGVRRQRSLLRTNAGVPEEPLMVGDLVFPGEYVAYKLVERIFRTARSYHFFYCRTREDDVDAREGTISHLSIPMQEMRQIKNNVCRELFGATPPSQLRMEQRLLLARTLRRRYNSSLKQIARLSGLVYDEVKNKL